jgi:dCTP deaminase
MSVLSDKEIKALNFIHPFSQASKGISSGVSAYGYDAKLDNKLYIFTKHQKNQEIIIDPKNFDQSAYIILESNSHFIIPPYGFALGKTVEYFKMPRDIISVCVGKSTYARCGLIVNVTPLEPGWEGYVTLEFSNTTPFSIKIYVNEGICQFLFFKAETQCETSYNEKLGKYMHQQDIVLPKQD